MKINLFYYVVIIWPLIVGLLAFFFHKKQNSTRPWTGGPISVPKSMWLAYTVSCWFLLPLVFFAGGFIGDELRVFYVFHLLSWWIRGPLELVMIYKWFNWTPRYGIAHDLFHVLGCGALLAWALRGGDPQSHLVAWVFAGVTIFSTLAEALFAFLFLRARSQQEEKENIYFASDDPKWIFINRVTASVVIPVYIHLVWQSYALTASSLALQ